MNMIRLFVFGSLYLMSGVSLACSCVFEDIGLEESVKKSFKSASSVVLARAIHIEEKGVSLSPDDPMPPDAFTDGDITQFNEIESWKGEHGKSFHTRINTMCCMCGYSFQVGESYLLKLYGPDEEGFYTTSVCSRTKPTEDAEEEIDVLNLIAHNKSRNPAADESVD